jgi:hypothetical protein
MTDSHIRWPDGYNPSGFNGPAQPVIMTEVPDGQGGFMTVIVPISLQAGLKTWIASVMDIPEAASKIYLLLFNNSPALGQPNSKIFRVWDIKANVNITANIATAHSIVLNVSRTADQGTGGTPINVKKTDTSDGNADNAIVKREITNPTFNGQDLASATVLIEESTGTEGRITLYKADSAIAPLVLNPTQGLVVQQGSFAGTGGRLNIHMYFTVDAGV